MILNHINSTTLEGIESISIQYGVSNISLIGLSSLKIVSGHFIAKIWIPEMYTTYRSSDEQVTLS